MAAALSISMSARQATRVSSRPPPRRQGRGPVPDSREACRHLEIRREQARAETGRRHAVRHRPAADAGHRLARRRSLHRHEQPRSARRLLAGQVHGKGQRRTPGRTALPRCPGIRFRLAVLLLRLRVEEDAAQPRVRRRRQGSRPLHDVHTAHRRVPGPLGTPGARVLRPAASSRRGTRMDCSSRSTDRGIARRCRRRRRT